jgi:hypothetical protein
MARNNALNFNRLSKYNFHFISLDEVILLEYLTFHHQKKTIDLVVHSRVESETGMKRSKQVRIFEELKDKGFIDWTFNGIRNFYTLNIDAVVNALPKLFTKEAKPAYQYYFYAQNPELFSKKKSKKVKIPKEVEPEVQKLVAASGKKEQTQRTKVKEKVVISENQMSLF